MRLRRACIHVDLGLVHNLHAENSGGKEKGGHVPVAAYEPTGF